MSRLLSGHLDDVDLDEVIRILALSRRSGLLDVEGKETRAELHFIAGRLVRVRLHDNLDSLGTRLAFAGVLQEADLENADTTETLESLIARIEERRGERQLLVRVDDHVADLLDAAVSRILNWRSGAFSFRASTDVSVPQRYVGDTAFTLPAGVDAEELSREARRRRQERDADPLASFGPRGARSRTTPPTAAGKTELIVVDDDPAFLASIERQLHDVGVSLTALPGAQRALERVPTALQEGARAVVVDLVMPRSTGRGILGGLEVIQALSPNTDGALFLALDDEHVDAEALARSLGVGVLRKPRSRDELPAFLNPVLQRLDRPPLPQAGFDLARELSSELGPGDDWRTEWLLDGRRDLDEAQKSLETLKALLGELNEPSFNEEIPLLLLRFASAFFVRGALFRVERSSGQLIGLGGFGLGSSDPGRTVRAIKIPMAADTVFARAIGERSGVRQTWWDSEWNTRLSVSLGGPRPREVYTAPLMSPRGLEAVLYADNGTDPRPFPDIALLEIFLQQSAAALERADLAREVQNLRSRPPEPASPLGE